MVFQNQFSLSLEVTRLLGPIRWATDKTAEAIMTRARDLRHSGSDIVVEEDLARVFGRCKISDTITSSFRTIITESTSNVPILEAIMLQGGPGPTVVRAFQDSYYFSMVVQLSLLVWTFSARNLATAIADALLQRSEGASSTSGLQSTPGRAGILGVLRACESQTSAFNWNMMLNAVSTMIGYGTDPAPMDFPPFILRGLLDMFPMVQTLPKDRFIHIHIPVSGSGHSGSSALIVWAHHVLGLNVLVIASGRNGALTRNVRFGASDLEQVLIEEVAADKEASLTLLDSHKENLLTIKPVPDEDEALIGSIRKAPARGWGNILFSDLLRTLDFIGPNCAAIISDMQMVTTAFAFLIAKHLVKREKPGRFSKFVQEQGYTLRFDVDEERLLEASKFLFNNRDMRRGEVEKFVAQYKSKALNEELLRPASLAASTQAKLPMHDEEFPSDPWISLCDFTQTVATFLIALAQVDNLNDCEDLMFARTDLYDLSRHSLVQQLESWTGDRDLDVKDEDWLQALAVPLISHQDHVFDLPWDKICLVSDKGWSAWISTLGNTDPTYTLAGSVRVGKGSPCRKGVWKSGIWDSQSYHTPSDWLDPTRAESCGRVASLRCSNKVSLETPYCGEGDDVFLVCARLREVSPEQQRLIHRIGYKRLQNCLWNAQLSRRCSHKSQLGKEITLGIDIATIAGFGPSLAGADERIVIFLTAHSIGARWLALAATPGLLIHTDDDELPTKRLILLRRNDCCFQCTIDQVAVQPEKWLIIL